MMGVVKYYQSTQISPHFNSSEFKCPHCNEVLISTELVNKLEELLSNPSLELLNVWKLYILAPSIVS